MKRITSLLLVLIMAFMMVACGSDSSSSVTSQQPSPGSEVPVSSSEVEAGETLEEYYERIRPNQSFLTGVAKDEDYPEGQRAVGISVNNAYWGWPHRGISSADILLEIGIESYVPRLMLFFEDYNEVPATGPIRSLRDQFLQFLMPWWMFVVHDGESTPTANMLRDWDYSEFDLSAAKYAQNTQDPDNLNSLTWRDRSYPASVNGSEFTEFTDGAHIAATIANNGLNDYRSYSPMFNFVSYELEPRVPDGGEVKEVTVVHSPRAYMTYFEYNDTTRQYELVSMHNGSTGRMEPILDYNNNERASFDNMLVIFAPSEYYPSTYLTKFNYGLGGLAFYFSQGAYEKVYWTKGGPNEAFLLYDWETREPLYINTGSSYIGIVNADLQEDFHDTIVYGTAGAVASDGAVANSIPDVD